MAWTAPRTWTDGETPTAAQFNAHIRDNELALSTHAHGGAAGDGSATPTGVDSITFDDIAAPGAPGASATRVYTRAGLLRFHANGGSEETVADNAHAADHEPGGSDAMAVDAATGTGSLRTLGTGAQQAAAGDHGHTWQEVATNQLYDWSTETGALGAPATATKEANTANNTWDLQERVTYTPSTATSVIVITGHASGYNALASFPTHEGFHTRIVVGGVQKATATVDVTGSQDNTGSNAHWIALPLVYVMIDNPASSTNFDFERKMEHLATSGPALVGWFVQVGITVTEINV